jgi:predicted nucleotidyltransferase
VLNAADQQQIDRALTLVRDVLHSNAVAAYLFGSAVLGGLGPESDLDMLVVSKRRTTRAEKQRLVHRLLATSGRRTPQGMWRRIELTIVVERDVKP